MQVQARLTKFGTTEPHFLMLSVIIPSYKDPLVHKTVASLLENAEGGIEVIVVLDGYTPKTPLVDDPRVVVVSQENTGMRGAINAGVRKARGEYLMRTDEHCLFAPRFDTTVLKDIKDNEIVTIRRFFLDAERWKVMDIPPVDYEKLIIDDKNYKFAGVRWTKRAEQRKDIMIDETMAMQGSCWFMKKSWWEKVIGELQSEGYGTHYGDSHEMVFKTWKAGGRLMVNKNTWFAHKHRSFKRTHHYSVERARPGWDYSISIWGDYYLNEIKPLWKI